MTEKIHDQKVKKGGINVAQEKQGTIIKTTGSKQRQNKKSRSGILEGTGKQEPKNQDKEEHPNYNMSSPLLDTLIQPLRSVLNL